MKSRASTSLKLTQKFKLTHEEDIKAENSALDEQTNSWNKSFQFANNLRYLRLLNETQRQSL